MGQRAISSFIATAVLLASGCSDDAVGTQTGTGSDGGGTVTGPGPVTTTSPTAADTTAGDNSGTGTTAGSGSTTADGTSETRGGTTGGGTTDGETTGGGTTGGATTDGTTTDGTSSDGTSSGSETTAGDTGTAESGGQPESAGFVGMSGTDAVMVFDTVAAAVIDGPISLLPEGDYPYDVSIRPDGAEVWIAGASGDGIVVLDATNNAILHQGGFSTGATLYAVDVAFSLDGAVAYVSGRDADALVLVDTTSYAELSVEATPVGNEPGKMAVNPCTGQVYVAEWYGDNLLTYDPGADSWSTVDIGDASLWDLVVDSTGSTLYVTDRGNDQVHVFDVSGGATPSATPEASIAVGEDPWGVDITPDGATVVVACEDDASVHFIDTATAASVGSLALDATADPRDVDISADGTIAYIPNGAVTGDDGVYAVDISLQTVAATITLGPATQANAVAVKPQPVLCDLR